MLAAQGFGNALAAIFQEAQNIDEKTMMLQYLSTLRDIGSSPATKFVVPMELTSLMQQFSTKFIDDGKK